MADLLVTAAQLHAIMPLAGARADAFAAPLAAAMLQFEVNAPTRAAAFLVQVSHESGQLHLLREIWGPTPAQRRYVGSADLGNTEAGDGKRFMRRGLIQVTGPDEERDFECGVCHSFVTDGRIQFLGDCTHALAGQTVPLAEFPEGWGRTRPRSTGTTSTRPTPTPSWTT